MSSPQNKSYLSGGLASFSPWGAKNPTPKPASGGDDQPASQKKGADYVLSHRNRLSLKEYPSDCPPLQARWYYAVDVAKRKPPSLVQARGDTKPLPAPKKYVSFSVKDSRSIEAAFQKLVAHEDAALQESANVKQAVSQQGDAQMRDKGNTSLEDAPSSGKSTNLRVPVNEDYLFDVDIEQRELAPVYWLGPVYDVRRGTWFHQEGSTLRPCDENLATQLEEGYLKVKPFRYATHKRSSSQPRPSSSKDREKAELSREASQLSSQYASDDLDIQGKDARIEAPSVVEGVSKAQPEQKTHRLFGAHMNSIVTYQDAKTAWILTDDFLSRMSSTVYQRFVGGGYLGGVKVVRGYTESKKPKEAKADAEKKMDAQTTGSGEADMNTNSTQKMEDLSEQATPAPADDEVNSPASPAIKSASQTRRQALERQVTNLVSSVDPHDPEKEEEEARKREEKEMEDDYREDEGESQEREIEHLILVTHGIGQRLGLRMESVNFVHDVNILRKTLKGVYASSADLQALNNELEKLPKNCRVQVLPVCWRHLLDFPKQRVRHKPKEHDLGDLASLEEEENYPSLDDITLDGVPAVRSLIADLALDILLYQSVYKGHISRIVQAECNRIFKLFLERNPNFNGHVSLMGHSLGSAILFDILCKQLDHPRADGAARQKRKSHDRQSEMSGEDRKTGLDLDFEVDSFFSVGSPIGLFQMLKGRKIAARHNSQFPSRPRDPTAAEGSFPHGRTVDSNTAANRLAEEDSLITISSPKCRRLFNIFHPTDPISYRIEPLISPAMSSLKPQPLPYTKKGIFGAPVGQGLSGIGARVGQSVSGLWSSFSSGIATSILTRSLGISGEDLKSGLPSHSGNQSSRDEGHLGGLSVSAGAGTNITGGNVISTTPAASQVTIVASDEKKRKLESDVTTAEPPGERPPTLIDVELETLYSGFQKHRKALHDGEGGTPGGSADWRALEEKGRKLDVEDQKVRALNPNGRVDYSIQEGAFDISLIASIASHLSYWADEDVSHFIISQLLSSYRVMERDQDGRDQWKHV